MTHICGEAWDTLCGRIDIEKIARRTGNLLTLDGTGDDEIQLQGIADYKFLPEHADNPVQNVRGDNNELTLPEDELTITEGGIVGELEELVEESDDEEEEGDSSSSDEEEDLLAVRGILGAEWKNGTIKFKCTWVGYEDSDTTLEPKANIQPKAILDEFIAAGEADGT